MLVLDLAKGKKPYGHIAYTRYNPKKRLSKAEDGDEDSRLGPDHLFLEVARKMGFLTDIKVKRAPRLVLKAAYRDRIPGGLADKKTPKDFDPVQLRAGMKVEREHTNDPKIAREIAQDHLTEDKDYYKKLKKIEKGCSLVMDLVKATPHERFVTTVMTEKGKVKKIGEGRFGARKVHFDNGVSATLKPKLHSTEKFRGINRSTQHMREAAAYQLDWKLLHFGIIPPTMLTMYGDRQASVQSWVVGFYAKDLVPKIFDKEQEDWRERIGQFLTQIDVEALRKVVLFDLIVNNTDRHAKNCLFDPITRRVYAIDNGLCFGKQYHDYFNVFHKYIFRHGFTLNEEESTLLDSITLDQLRTVLKRYVSEREIQETYFRIRWLLEQGDLSFIKLCEGLEGKNEFPDRKAWFKSQAKKQVGNKVLLAVEKMSRVVPSA